MIAELVSMAYPGGYFLGITPETPPLAATFLTFFWAFCAVATIISLVGLIYYSLEYLGTVRSDE